MAVPVLLVNGTVGVGKSTVTAEISDALSELEIPHAAVDLDALIWQWPPTSPWNNDLLFANLRALWPNYRAHGATRLVLARVVEQRAHLAPFVASVPDAAFTVCRLTAPESQRMERLRQRMTPGPALDWHLHRTVELEEVLSGSDVDDFTVDNGDHPVREVALEVLNRAGWLGGSRAGS